MKKECLTIISIGILLFIFSTFVRMQIHRFFLWVLGILLIYTAIKINERYDKKEEEK